MGFKVYGIRFAIDSGVCFRLTVIFFNISIVCNYYN